MHDELVKSLQVCGRMTSIDDNCISYVNGCCEAFPDCAYALMDDAANAIVELSHENESLAKSVNEAAELLHKRGTPPKWIPVTERLPKADEYDVRGYAVPYLVMNGWMRVTARRTKDYWVLFGEGKVLEYVTHWMPLPEPPKEETE